MEYNTLFYNSSPFPNVQIRTTAGKFMETLNSLVNYDDGQGRSYDILDEEINQD